MQRNRAVTWRASARMWNAHLAHWNSNSLHFVYTTKKMLTWHFKHAACCTACFMIGTDATIRNRCKGQWQHVMLSSVRTKWQWETTIRRAFNMMTLLLTKKQSLTMTLISDNMHWLVTTVTCNRMVLTQTVSFWQWSLLAWHPVCQQRHCQWKAMTPLETWTVTAPLVIVLVIGFPHTVLLQAHHVVVFAVSTSLATFRHNNVTCSLSLWGSQLHHWTWVVVGEQPSLSWLLISFWQWERGDCCAIHSKVVSLLHIWASILWAC